MSKKATLGLYLEDEELKRQIKVTAARKGISATAYCTQAIRERLTREGPLSEEENERRKAALTRMEALRRKTGPIGVSTAELVKEGRRR